MGKTNRHGLERDIPDPIKREIRKRCKFGCVICRQGFYHFEHISPLFEDAKVHDPDAICCLCGLHHDLVTRGVLDKETVASAYRRIREQTLEEVGPPFGSFYLTDGRAELAIGGLVYSPAVQTVLRFHGHDLIRAVPGGAGEPGSITATFTDDDGNEVLWLIENQWVGSLENWDITTEGTQITVRAGLRDISLQLRLGPPRGRIVIERLDMRIGTGPGAGHVLVSEHTFALGRWLSDDSVAWSHAEVVFTGGGRPDGAAIEFSDPQELSNRSPGNASFSIGHEGLISVPLGIAIASRCGSLRVCSSVPCVIRPISGMRTAVFHRPDQLVQYMMTGKFR